MANNDFENGVWRTVGGRRIFIRDGESLSSAMKKSGKFKKLKNAEDNKNVDQKSNEELQNEVNNFMKDSGWDDYLDTTIENYDNFEGYKKSVEKEMNSLIKRGEANEDDLDYVMGELNKMQPSPKSETHLKFERDLGEKLTEHTTADGHKWYSSKSIEDDERRVRENIEKAKKERYNADRDKNYRDYMDGKKSSEEYFKDAQKSKDNYYGKAESNLERYEKEAAAVKSQVNDIEQATGSKVKNAFETDLYGNGKETRFMLDDNKWIAHTKESFGQKEDTWSVNELKNGNIESKSYKSYDDMIKNIGGSEEKANQSKYIKEVKSETKDTVKFSLNKNLGSSQSNTAQRMASELKDELEEKYGRKIKSWNFADKNNAFVTFEKSSESKKGETNKAYKNAFEYYKKKHPNSKLTLSQFIDMSEGK